MPTIAKQKGLSNIELAANSTWIIALTRLECPFCSFVSSDIRLTALNVACPRCGKSGSARQLFPSGTCIRRLEIVAESYVKAYAAVNKKKAALAEDMRQILGRTPEYSWLDSAVRQVRKLSRASGGKESEHARFLAGLERRLALTSRAETSRVFYLLATYTDTSTEHYNVVTSTASLFEQLFRELLVELLVSHGEEYVKARNEASKLRTWRRMEERFKSITGVSLQKAVSGFGVRGMYSTWRDVLKRRNEYSHVTPWAVGARMAERAFDAAKNAFGLFSHLHNAYCLDPIPADRTSGQSAASRDSEITTVRKGR